MGKNMAKINLLSLFAKNLRILIFTNLTVRFINFLSQQKSRKAAAYEIYYNAKKENSQVFCRKRL